jgi:hypothetical protein
MGDKRERERERERKGESQDRDWTCHYIEEKKEKKWTESEDAQ